jgi:DNA-binding response OmpR family regulator
MQGKLISLTEYESLALKLLIEERRTAVSYDELADAIWGVDADEKFSITAITKLIERPSKTIENNGVFPSIIQTCKGYGYMLVD